MLNLIFVIEDFLYFLNEHPGLTPSCNFLSLKNVAIKIIFSNQKIVFIATKLFFYES